MAVLRFKLLLNVIILSFIANEKSTKSCQCWRWTSASANLWRKTTPKIELRRFQKQSKKINLEQFDLFLLSCVVNVTIYLARTNTSHQKRFTASQRMVALNVEWTKKKAEHKWDTNWIIFHKCSDVIVFSIELFSPFFRSDSVAVFSEFVQTQTHPRIKNSEFDDE